MLKWRTVEMRLELSVLDGTDISQLMQTILNYLLADEINGLPDTFSIDGITVDE
jgi:hypothetical protein